MMGSMLRRGSLGDGSTVTLDFTSGSLDSMLTFSRSSSGTYVNASGLVQTASSNTARFEYDSSGNALGLKLEPAATNLLAHTERLDEAQVTTEQYWVTTYSITGSTVAISGPDGVASSATQFGPIAGNATCIASAAMGTSALRNFSFWAKQSSGSTNLEYTLDNGTNWVAVATTSSWQRFTIAATTAAQRVGFRFASNNVYEIWGTQLETGNIPTSYVKNVSAAAGATRASEYLECSGTNLSSWFTAGSAYTMLFKYRMNSPTLWAGSGIDRAVGQLSTSGSSNRTYMYAAYRTTDGNAQIGRAVRAFDDATTNTLDLQIGSASNMPAAASNNAFAIAVNTNDAAMCGSNQFLSTSSGCTIMPSQNRFNIGMIGGGQIINGWFTLVKYWPQRLSNATLQGLVQ
jgi:hypothetical protein